MIMVTIRIMNVQGFVCAVLVKCDILQLIVIVSSSQVCLPAPPALPAVGGGPSLGGGFSWSLGGPGTQVG